MAYRGKHHRQHIAPHESVRGWVFFFLYLVVFPILMGAIQRSMDRELPVAEANVIYYLLCATAILLVFWSYLKDSFSRLLDHLPENLLALVTGFIGLVALQAAISLIPFPVSNPNTYSYPLEYLLSPRATIAVVVVLIPFVEEVLFRGLLFGSLRSYSRVLAWIVSVTFYCIYCVWQFTFSSGGFDPRYLLLAFQYLPAALAFHWACDKGGSVWSSVLLHIAASACSLYALLARSGIV